MVVRWALVLVVVVIIAVTTTTMRPVEASSATSARTLRMPSHGGIEAIGRVSTHPTLRALQEMHDIHPQLRALFDRTATGRAASDPLLDLRRPQDVLSTGQHSRFAAATPKWQQPKKAAPQPSQQPAAAPSSSPRPGVTDVHASPFDMSLCSQVFDPLTDTPYSERDALYLLWRCTGGSDDGPAPNTWFSDTNWINKTSSSAPASVCDGVALDVMPLWGVNCTVLRGWWVVAPPLDAPQQVRWLGLAYNGLTGVIPDVFDSFPGLQILDLSFSRLHGPLPASLNRLPWLVAIQLSSNEFSGPLLNLTLSTNLVGLYMGSNALTGPLLPYAHMRAKLYGIELYDNFLSGPLLSYFDLPGLVSISLSTNELSGTTPPSYGHLPLLVLLGLNVNNFTGSVPDLSGCTLLQNYYIGNNDFTGEFPLTKLPRPAVNLTQMVMENSMFTGPFPAFDALNFPALNIVNGEDSEFSGEIPLSLTSLPAMYYLNLGNNWFTGAPPIGFVSPQFQFLSVADNQLTGFPDALLRSTSLIQLVLRGNNFTYSFTPANPSVLYPGTLCELRTNSSLILLDASNAGFVGDMVDIVDCMARWVPGLIELALSGNGITTQPVRDANIRATDGRKTFTRLRSVDLSHNALTVSLMPSLFGDLPDSYWAPFIDNMDFRGNPLAYTNGYEYLYTPQTDRYVVDPVTGLTCPNRMFTLLGTTLYLDPYMWDFAMCNCSVSSTGDASTGAYFNSVLQRCLPCPAASYACSTSATDALYYTSNTGAINLLRGHYPLYALNASVCAAVNYAVNTSSRAGDALSATVVPTVTLPCQPAQSCAPHGASGNAAYESFACADGFQLDSLLCSKCQHGYYAVDSTCVACTSAIRVLVPLSWILLAVVLVVYVRFTDYSPHSSALLAIAVFWLQLTSVLTESSAASGSGSSDSLASNGWVTLFGLQSIVSFRPYAWECVVSSVDYAAYFWLQFAILLALVLVLVCVRCLRPHCPTGDTNDSGDDSKALKATLRTHASSASASASSWDQSSIADYKAMDDPHPGSAVAVDGRPPSSSTVTRTNPPSPALSAASVDVIKSASSSALFSTNTTPISGGRSGAPSLAARFAFGAYFLLDTLYLPLTTRVLELFRCDDHRSVVTSALQAAGIDPSLARDTDQLHFVRAAPYVSCESGEYHALVAFASLVFIFYVVGWPAFCLYTLYRERYNLDTSPLRHELGFLWASVRRTRFYWYSAVVTGRKLILAIAVTQLSQDSVNIPVLVFALISVSMISNLLMRPYVHSGEGWAELGLLLLASVTYQTDIWASLSPQYNTAPIQGVLGVVTGIVKFVLVAWLVKMYADKCRQSKACTVCHSRGRVPQRELSDAA